MAVALTTSTDLLPLLIGFVQQVGDILFHAALDLITAGRPTFGLIATCKPDESLGWAVDFLVLVGGLADSVCRRRESEQHKDFSTILPAVDDVVWPLSSRLDLLERLKLWSGHGANGTAIRRGEQVDGDGHSSKLVVNDSK